MRKGIGTVIMLLLLIPYSSGFAQDTIKVNGIIKEMHRGRQPGYKMDIPLAELKSTEKEWGKYIGKGSNAKVIRDKNGIWIEGARLASISRSPLNVYSNLFAAQGGLLLETWFEADSVFIAFDTVEVKSVAIQSFLHDFGISMYKESYQGLIETENKTLKKMQDELLELQSDQSKLEKGIRENERNITANEDKIVENKSDSERKVAEIEKQKDLVQEYRKDPEKEKIYKKELQALKKDKDKILKDRDRLYRGIDDYRDAIRKGESGLEQNKADQTAKEKEITDQKAKIATMEEVLKNIK